MAAREEAVLILTGPPGSGKTTVARLLAMRYARAVHLESDAFWHAIVRGYVEPWKPESHEQNAMVVEIVGEAARRYAQAGYFTIVDGIVGPRWFFEPLRDSLRGAGLDVAYAILRPPPSIAVERAQARPSTRLSDAGVIEQLWQGFADLGALERHVIDNGEQTPDSTAGEIAERLGAGVLAV